MANRTLTDDVVNYAESFGFEFVDYNDQKLLNYNAVSIVIHPKGFMLVGELDLRPLSISSRLAKDLIGAFAFDRDQHNGTD